MSDRPVGDELDRQLRSAMDDLVDQAPLLPEPEHLPLPHQPPHTRNLPTRPGDDLTVGYLRQPGESNTPTAEIAAPGGVVHLFADAERPTRARRHVFAGAALAVAGVLILVGALVRGNDDAPGLATADQLEISPNSTVSSVDPGPSADVADAVGNPATDRPDVAGAVRGDDGAGPLPLGVVGELPDAAYLDFLFECAPSDECSRDAYFVVNEKSAEAAGGWGAGLPFFVRHGFINENGAPLGERSDVVLYVTRRDGPDLGDGVFELDQTYRFTPDWVLRGTSGRCGPADGTQTEPTTCEWFVHDFPDGLPEGRYDLWAVWQAPCSAWVDLGFTDSCADLDEVVSLFSSSVNAPFYGFPPFDLNEAQQ